MQSEIDLAEENERGTKSIQKQARTNPRRGVNRRETQGQHAPFDLSEKDDSINMAEV